MDRFVSGSSSKHSGVKSDKEPTFLLHGGLIGTALYPGQDKARQRLLRTGMISQHTSKTRGKGLSSQIETVGPMYSVCLLGRPFIVGKKKTWQAFTTAVVHVFRRRYACVPGI